MKNKIIILFLLVLPLIATAQPNQDALRDSKWVLGYGVEDLFDEEGNMLMDFLGDTMQISTLYTDMNMSETNASVCDTAGALLFYTNGIHIRDRNHDIMAGCDTLNPGLTSSMFDEYGYIVPQGALILPKPGSDHLYYVFHSNYGYYTQFVEVIVGDYLYYTLVDMNGNNGLGEVIDLHHAVIDDFLDYGKINACRHANGRDWWILMAKFHSNSYYSFLLDPDGLHDMGLVSGIHDIIIGLGQGVFSPDGSKYAIYQLYNTYTGTPLYVYDFDRCTGVLNEIAYDTIVDTAYCGGAAISPNSRYLYLSSGLYVYQYDLQAADIAATRTTIAVWDGFLDWDVLATTFYLAQLAPNGKIYICSNNGVRYLHVIEQPDSAGLACQVMQHGLQLPHFNGFTVPHFPNFRLGALENSPCDTLPNVVTVGVPPPPSAPSAPPLSTLQVYPNPATEVCHISFGAPLPKGGTLRVYDVLGREVWRLPLSAASVGCSLDVRTWTAGVYVAVVYDAAGGSSRSVRVMVGR